jgi:hypothetical protein
MDRLTRDDIQNIMSGDMTIRDTVDIELPMLAITTVDGSRRCGIHTRMIKFQ